MYLLENLQSILIRHHDIQQNQIEELRLDSSQSFSAILC